MYYADVAEPLVLLAIDTDLLDVPVQVVGSAYRILGPVNPTRSSCVTCHVRPHGDHRRDRRETAGLRREILF